jgi:hypothetical protein
VGWHFLFPHDLGVLIAYDHALCVFYQNFTGLLVAVWIFPENLRFLVVEKNQANVRFASAPILRKLGARLFEDLVEVVLALLHNRVQAHSFSAFELSSSMLVKGVNHLVDSFVVLLTDGCMFFELLVRNSIVHV